MKTTCFLKKQHTLLVYFLCSTATMLFEMMLLLLFKTTVPLLKNHIVIANTLAVIIGSCVHYILTSKLVFKVNMNIASATAYLITFLIGLGIQDAAIWIAYHKLLPPLMNSESALALCSKAISLAGSFFIIYFLRKYVNASLAKQERT